MGQANVGVWRGDLRVWGLTGNWHAPPDACRGIRRGDSQGDSQGDSLGGGRTRSGRD